MAERHACDARLADVAGAGNEGASSATTWNAILAPAGTPQPIVSSELRGAINRAMEDPSVIKRLEEAGVDPTPGRNAQADRRNSFKAELAKWVPSSRRRAQQSELKASEFHGRAAADCSLSAPTPSVHTVRKA
jgi:tripartite-type tricarboxylate transporter receptor subunit TctC